MLSRKPKDYQPEHPNKNKLIFSLIGILYIWQLVSSVYLLYSQQVVSDNLEACNCLSEFHPQDALASSSGSPTALNQVLEHAERIKRSPKSHNRTHSHKSKKERKARSDKQVPSAVLLGVSPAAPGAAKQANLEFINPKFRDEYLSRTEGADDQDNPWVWLNAYSRIPVNAIQDFCSATKDYCPPGPAGPLGPIGPVGDRGSKGDRGDRGLPGEQGVRGPAGPIGPPGPKGPKGDIGKPGLPGLNGRDGVPGEPGLDGVPGRSGTPGFDGVPGMDGMPGLPGYNGTDGTPGDVGPSGEPGPIGPQGLTGPRGKPGRPGVPGIPGIPGVNTWVVNSTDPRRIVLVPPSILGMDVMLQENSAQGNATRTVVIQEGKNLRLRCPCTGNPRPEVAWMRADGLLTPMGSWQTSDVVGPIFNITRVHREHMGVYVCVADNGIPPPAHRTINVEVHFAPLIKVDNPSVAVSNGSSVVLECYVEAFPESVCYWERADGRSIDGHHRALIRDQGKYKVHMMLNLTVTNPVVDYGRYHCVSKNELGITRGEIDVYAIDPRYTQTMLAGNEVKTWGATPPDMIDLEDMCPPIPDCPKCPALNSEKCRDGGLGMFDVLGRLDIRQLGNDNYSTIANRTQDCLLVAIGKPVFHRYTNTTYGNWMRDSLPRTPYDADKYWATKANETHVLYEFMNKTAFKRDVPSRNYTLPFGLKGYLHVVYNGSLYYHQQEEARVIRYELASERNTMVNLPNATVTGNIYLYGHSQSYLDFSVDETGLWVIYNVLSGSEPMNNTAVAKLNPYSLEIEYVWNISVNNQRAGEMFVACGVLYAIDSSTDRTTKIRFALDLYRNKLLEVDGLTFTNPFRKTSMVGYNHRTKELYTWDNGNQLTYPVKFTDIGYNSPDSNDLANDRIEISNPEALIQDDWDGIVDFA